MATGAKNGARILEKVEKCLHRLQFSPKWKNENKNVEVGQFYVWTDQRKSGMVRNRLSPIAHHENRFLVTEKIQTFEHSCQETCIFDNWHRIFAESLESFFNDDMSPRPECDRPWIP